MAVNDTIRAFLDEKRFAVLATINPDGTAQQTVMWYLLRDNHLVMNTKRGRHKDRNLLRDRRVSICVEDGYRYVTIIGEVEFDEDHARAQADIAALALRYDGPEKAAQRVRDQFSREERVTLLLPLDRVLVHGFDE